MKDLQVKTADGSHDTEHAIPQFQLMENWASPW